ncbi:MAG TPA: hypothetical protein VM432_06280, partial [Bdellovibrionales bacterium]|nr:hypothetical protein [Bdellovibrionales bacterium]
MANEQGSSRKSKRKLTPFLCKEMLYEYAIGTLDEERHAAVEQVLSHDRECQEILASINSGIDYVEKLARTEVPESSLEVLKDADNIVSIGRRYSSWSAWPESFRWSVTALGVSALIGSIVLFVPWSKIPMPNMNKKVDQVEVAQIERPKTPESAEAVADAHDEGEEGEVPPIQVTETSGDEYGEDEGLMPPEGPSIADNAAKAANTVPLPGADRVVPMTPTPITKASAPVPAGTPTKVAAAVPAPTPIPTQAPKPTRAPSGFVFRAFMSLNNLDELAPQIADQIHALGGEKAGEVELGWKRGTGRYYHFAIPEESEPKLMELL